MPTTAGKCIKQGKEIKQKPRVPKNFDFCFLRNFWLLLPKFYFWKGDWKLDPFSYFSKIFFKEKSRNSKIQNITKLSITGVKPTPLICKFQMMCISRSSYG